MRPSGPGKFEAPNLDQGQREESARCTPGTRNAASRKAAHVRFEGEVASVRFIFIQHSHISPQEKGRGSLKALQVA
jgi:hypothetical protein